MASKTNKILIRKDNTSMPTKRKLAKLLTHLGQCE